MSIDPTTLQGAITFPQAMMLRGHYLLNVKPLADAGKPMSKSAASKAIACALDLKAARESGDTDAAAKLERTFNATRAALLKAGAEEVAPRKPKAKKPPKAEVSAAKKRAAAKAANPSPEVSDIVAAVLAAMKAGA